MPLMINDVQMKNQQIKLDKQQPMINDVQTKNQQEYLKNSD
jgi:hypothetical protein